MLENYDHRMLRHIRGLGEGEGGGDVCVYVCGVDFFGKNLFKAKIYQDPPVVGQTFEGFLGLLGHMGSFGSFKTKMY